MRNALKLLIVAAVAGAALAEPALAQSFTPGLGTANILPLAYAPHGTQHRTARDGAFTAYAQAPERGTIARDDAGNASVGYETLLATH